MNLFGYGNIFDRDTLIESEWGPIWTWTDDDGNSEYLLGRQPLLGTKICFTCILVCDS